MNAYIKQEQRPAHRGKEISDQRIGEILKSAEWGVLSTVAADGEPHATPLSFAWDEQAGRLILHTYRTGAKIDALRHDDRVCFTVVGETHLITDKFAAAYESLVIYGRMKQIEGPEAALKAAILFCRKFAPQVLAGLSPEESDHNLNEMAMMMEAASGDLVMFEIIPRHFSSKQRNMDR